MAYTIPPPLNTDYAIAGGSEYGRCDSIHDVIGTQIEEPKFVDNAVNHAIIEANSVGDIALRKTKLKKPNPSDFIVTHQRKYRFEEENSSLRLSHVDKSTTPYFNGALLNSNAVLPPLLVDADDHTLLLKPESVIDTNDGSRVILFNMKGKTLNEFGFEDTTHFRLTHQISVGLRTTDLVQKLFNNSLHGLNSISLGLPITPSKLRDGKRNPRHSMTFLAKDFYATTIPTAIRAVARHDHYSLFHDRFGNFIYTPKTFNVVDREIGQKRGAGGVRTDPITEAANRIMLEGKSQAANDVIQIVVDDAEMQKKEGVIRQMRVQDPTATNIMSARKSANQLLRLNRKAQGSIFTEQHARSWDISPGEVVDFKHESTGEEVKKAVIETEHESTGESAFQLASYESGLEGVLNAFADDGDASGGQNKNVDRKNQIVSFEQSGVGRTQLKVKGMVTTRSTSINVTRNTVDATITHDNSSPNVHSGVLLGHRGVGGENPARSAIGNGYTPRRGGVFSSGTGILTIITGGGTTGFPNTGVLVLTNIFGSTYNVATVSYTGKTPTTFTGVSIIAPAGGTIPSTISEGKLLRPRAHEVRTTKTTMRRRRL